MKKIHFLLTVCLVLISVFAVSSDTNAGMKNALTQEINTFVKVQFPKYAFAKTSVTAEEEAVK